MNTPLAINKFYNFSAPEQITTNVTNVIKSCVSGIIPLIDDEYVKNLSGIDFKATTSNNDIMLIFHLNRDQRIKFKRLCEKLSEEFPNLKSAYIFYDNRYMHIFGYKYIEDRINRYIYYISPWSPLLSLEQSKFYKKIFELSPVGRTRNAILLDHHRGLIALHLSGKYNRLYCIDNDKTGIEESKVQFKNNKVHNCLLFNTETNQWLIEFKQGMHTPPGKKPNLGLLIANTEYINNHSVSLMSDIDPETIIIYTKNKKDFELFNKEFDKYNYQITYNFESNHFSLIKIRRKIEE